jgi:hypothetical protein
LFISAGGLGQLDENTNVANEGHVVAPIGGQNHIGNEGDDLELPFYKFHWIMNAFLYLPSFR